MKKRILLSGLGVIIFSASSGMAAKPFCGMFLGGDLGVSLGGFKESVTQGQTPIEKVNVQSSGLTGALSLGGAYTFENGLFFGGGLYGGLSRLQASHHRESASSDLDLKFKSSNFFGLHLQPGFVVGKETPVVFHLIGGVEFAKCKFNISSTRERLANANRVVEGNTSSKRLRGVSIGAGMSGMVSKGISLGLKFIHNRYKKRTFEHAQFAQQNPGAAPLVFTLKPKDNRVLMTLTKYFG